MQLPVKAHYATLAMLALAQNYASDKPLPARQIAGDHKIPIQFLGQILQLLRAARLVDSSRGPNGGFLLVRSPDSITVAEIIDAVCPASESLVGQRDGDEQSPLHQAVCRVWDDLRSQQRESLAQIALGTLLERAADHSPMFYI